MLKESYQMGKIWLIKVAVSMIAQCCDTSSHWVRWLAEKQQQRALMSVCVMYKCLELRRAWFCKLHRAPESDLL